MAATITSQINSGPSFDELTRIEAQGIELPQESQKIEKEVKPVVSGGPPKRRVCHLCGVQFPLRDFKVHLQKCEKRWKNDEGKKPKRERRPLPPEPQLPNNQEVTPFIPEEQLKLLNDLAAHVWKSRSLERCTTCGRTFNRDQLEKHRRACHGRKDSAAFGRSTHSYKSSVEAIQKAADKRKADQEWSKPQSRGSMRARQARVESRLQVPKPWGSAKALTRLLKTERSAEITTDSRAKPKTLRRLIEERKEKERGKYGAWKTTGKRIDRTTHKSQNLDEFTQMASGSSFPPPPPFSNHVNPAWQGEKERKKHSRPKPNEVQLKERIAELERTQTQLLSHLESIESKIGALKSEQPLVHGQIFSDLMVPEAIRHVSSRENAASPFMATGTTRGSSKKKYKSLSIQKYHDETPVGPGQRRAMEWEKFYASTIGELLG